MSDAIESDARKHLTSNAPLQPLDLYRYCVADIESDEKRILHPTPCNRYNSACRRERGRALRMPAGPLHGWSRLGLAPSRLCHEILCCRVHALAPTRNRHQKPGGVSHPRFKRRSTTTVPPNTLANVGERPKSAATCLKAITSRSTWPTSHKTGP